MLFRSAKPYVKDVVDLKGRKIAGDLKGGSSMDAKMVMRHFGVDPEKDVTWIDSRGKPPNTERFRLALFEKGEVDAVCCDPPHWNIAVQMGGHDKDAVYGDKLHEFGAPHGRRCVAIRRADQIAISAEHLPLKHPRRAFERLGK